MHNDLIALAERVESLLDRARPVEWEAIDDAICDKEYGFTLGRMDSEIYPSDYDAANAKLVVALVNAAPTIAAALRSRVVGADALDAGEGVERIVAGKRLKIKPGAPEIALLCRAIFRAGFADDEDEAVVNQKYAEWPEDQAKAIRAAHFVLRALGGNGSVVRALSETRP